jgi:hypothetical protein
MEEIPQGRLLEEETVYSCVLDAFNNNVGQNYFLKIKDLLKRIARCSRVAYTTVTDTFVKSGEIPYLQHNP